MGFSAGALEEGVGWESVSSRNGAEGYRGHMATLLWSQVGSGDMEIQIAQSGHTNKRVPRLTSF